MTTTAIPPVPLPSGSDADIWQGDDPMPWRDDEFRVAHYSRVDAVRASRLGAAAARVGTAAKEGRKWDFTTGCCGRDPTAPSARTASAAPILKAIQVRADEPDMKDPRRNRGRQIDLRASGNRGCSTGSVSALRP